MTREEREQALEWFKNRPVTMSGAKKMYDLAIEALSAEGDTISRKKTLERLTNISYNLCKTEAEDKIIEYAKTMVITMPSAQKTQLSKQDATFDYISRQAALYAIYGICNEPVAWLIRAAREIEKLPSAQPEIIRCKDCKYMTEHYDTDGNAPYWTCSEWDSGTDYDGFCHYAERRTDG